MVVLPMFLFWGTFFLGACYLIPVDILFSARFFFLLHKAGETAEKRAHLGREGLMHLARPGRDCLWERRLWRCGRSVPAQARWLSDAEKRSTS
jgi:hypothetical protein